ncbi:glycosyltransferase [Bdellovibrio sp. HCB337]|uniref:glycosyltransferase n=1 Tax=Bdellovibrio sp. HCB337 TaxID=3394358 RepID=UPI0039A598C5
MAKIILVTEKVNSTSWPLALSLKAQQHEVIFLTSHGEEATNTDGIRFMAYFKTWSFLEGLRVLPMLFSYEPQVLHIILEQGKMTGAHAVLASYAKSHPLMVLTTSLLQFERRLRRGNPTRLLLQESDIVTCPSVDSLAKLRGLSVRSKKQGRGILPPALDLYESTLLEEPSYEDAEAEMMAEESWTRNLREEPYFLIPCFEKNFSPESLYFRRIARIAETHFVVLMGSNQDWPLRSRKMFEQWMDEQGLKDRWMFSGNLPKNLEKDLLKRTKCLILAGIKLSPQEISQFYLKSIQCNTPLALDSKQASVHAHLWQKDVNCWILNHESLDKEFASFLLKDDFRPPQSLQAKLSQNRHLTDTPLNELNRLYTRALSQLK